MQKFMILKTTEKDYHIVENKINDLIARGSIINSISPIVTKQHANGNHFSLSEAEILVFILHTEAE